MNENKRGKSEMPLKKGTVEQPKTAYRLLAFERLEIVLP
jgi:hypothetical protein